jgi:hypothetical protein
MSAKSTDRPVKWMRRIARALSVVIIAITLFIAVGHLVAPEPVEADYPPVENLLPLVMVLSVLGLGLAWRWEGLGAAITLGFFGLHLILYWAIRGRFFPLQMLPIFSPVVITGLLFLACWWRSRAAQGEARHP